MSLICLFFLDTIARLLPNAECLNRLNKRSRNCSDFSLLTPPLLFWVMFSAKANYWQRALERMPMKRYINNCNIFRHCAFRWHFRISLFYQSCLSFLDTTLYRWYFSFWLFFLFLRWNILLNIMRCYISTLIKNTIKQYQFIWNTLVHLEKYSCWTNSRSIPHFALVRRPHSLASQRNSSRLVCIYRFVKSFSCLHRSEKLSLWLFLGYFEANHS